MNQLNDKTKTILEFTALVAIVAAFAAFVIPNAQGQSFSVADLYAQQIVLYEGESITITNEQSTPHSVTSIDNVFNSGSLSSGASYKLTLPQQSGTYSFYDAATNQTGTIQMIYASLGVDITSATAGDMITIQGENFKKSNQLNLIVTKPDGSTYQDLTIFLTGNGKVHLPLQTSRNDQNGIYTITAPGYSKAITSFTLSGGYTADAPLEPSPVVTNNSTETTPEPQTQDAPSSSNTSSQNTTINIDTSNLNFTASEKATLIALLQKLIDLLNSTAN